MTPFEVTELSESDVMGLQGVSQDASFDLIADHGIVFGRVDPISGFILYYLEVDDFEQDGNAGIKPDIHEDPERMNGHDPPGHMATSG